jgi:hypothetical protein
MTSTGGIYRFGRRLGRRGRTVLSLSWCFAYRVGPGVVYRWMSWAKRCAASALMPGRTC